MKNLPLGFWYRISAALIDVAMWFVAIGVLDYLFPGIGFLVVYLVLSVVFSLIDKKLGGKTLGQTILGLESKKEELAYSRTWLDKSLSLITWFIPLAYFIQPFWVKTLPEENAWYDKSLKRKMGIPNRVKVSKLAYPVLIILLIAVSTAIASYFIILPF